MGRGGVSAETLQGLSSEALWALRTMLVAHFHDKLGGVSWHLLAQQYVQVVHGGGHDHGETVGGC